MRDELERKSIYGDYSKLRITHSSPRGRVDAGRTRSAKVWLVRRFWIQRDGKGVAETGVQTAMVLDQPDYSGGGRWRSIPGVWVLDTPGSSWGRGRDVHGDCQG